MNPNHVESLLHCGTCQLDYVFHKKSNHYWVTSRANHVLRGMPICFEAFTYDCAKCSGKVRRHYMKLDGVTPETTGLLTKRVNDSWVKQYKIIYRCDTCGHGGETLADYYNPKEEV